MGLGNPGKSYEKTRHNAGFVFIDRLLASLNPGQSDFKEKLGAQVCVSSICNQELLVVKPQSFMNESGRSVAALAGFYKIKPEEIIVAHDELDVPLGTLRIKDGGGDGGHNGVKSLIACLGSPAFCRLRLGIGRPLGVIDPSDWVLGRFSGEEHSVILNVFERAAEALSELLKNGLKSAQNRYN